jgi:hypothetical protein
MGTDNVIRFGCAPAVFVELWKGWFNINNLAVWHNGEFLY